jgi:anthranilate phosphoribosyltransferase
VTPEELGLERAELTAIAGGSPEQNAAVVRRVLAGEPGPARDVITLNAGAAILAAGAAASLAEAVEQARGAIDSGAAESVLARLAELSSELG